MWHVRGAGMVSPILEHFRKRSLLSFSEWFVGDAELLVGLAQNNFAWEGGPREGCFQAFLALNVRPRWIEAVRDVQSVRGCFLSELGIAWFMSVLEQDLRHLDDDSDEDDFVEHYVLNGSHLSMTAAASLWATSSGSLLAEDKMTNNQRLPPFIPSANLDLEHKRFMEDRAEPIFRFSKSEDEFRVCRLDIESVVTPDR